MSLRLRIAALVAPIVAVLAVWLGLFLSARRLLGQPLPEGATGHSLFFSLFFGLPAAYVLSALLAWPAYHTLRERGRLQLGPVVGGAALAGALAVPLVWGTLWSDWTATGWLALLGAAAGTVAGLTFWLTGLRGQSRPPAT